MELQINGRSYSINSDPQTSLLNILRNELDLTGTKYGCGEAQCGACTVLLDGSAVRSCSISAKAAAGRKITTIEGLEKDGQLHPVQEAYLKVDVFQCGYCAPGMIMSTIALLNNTPNPSEEEIIDFMNGNICRCGTYPRIIKAIKEVSKT